MARHAGGRICWFSMRGGDETPGFLLKHVGEGGLAVLYDPLGGDITLHDRGVATPVCNARAIPATLGGAALFNVQNALAAAAMAYGVGVPPAAIAAALSGFDSSFEQNPGRMNVHDGHGFRVIVDYAHNPDALRALGRAVAALRPAAGRTIAMLSIPGDRRDAEIRAMGEIGAEFFDHLVFRETPDNRGRPGGEVIRLMREGAEATGCDPSRITGVHREEEAVEACLRMARPGDLVILTPTRVEEVWRQTLDFRPAAAADGAPEGLVLEPPHG